MLHTKYGFVTPLLLAIYQKVIWNTHTHIIQPNLLKIELSTPQPVIKAAANPSPVLSIHGGSSCQHTDHGRTTRLLQIANNIFATCQYLTKDLECGMMKHTQFPCLLPLHCWFNFCFLLDRTMYLSHLARCIWSNIAKTTNNWLGCTAHIIWNDFTMITELKTKFGDNCVFFPWNICSWWIIKVDFSFFQRINGIDQRQSALLQTCTHLHSKSP